MRLFRDRYLPRWLGFVAHIIGFPLMHAIVPWALSLLAIRHGWTGSRPGSWNWIGLLPVAAGFWIVVQAMRPHFTAAAGGWKIESTQHYPTPAYLLRDGIYKYTRNPIYLAEGAIWAGWIIFYGSLAILGVFCLASVLTGPLIVTREERGLEARFGESYRVYKRTVPRWFGKP